MYGYNRGGRMPYRDYRQPPGPHPVPEVGLFAYPTYLGNRGFGGVDSVHFGRRGGTRNPPRGRHHFGFVDHRRNPPGLNYYQGASGHAFQDDEVSSTQREMTNPQGVNPSNGAFSGSYSHGVLSNVNNYREPELRPASTYDGRRPPKRNEGSKYGYQRWSEGSQGDHSQGLPHHWNDIRAHGRSSNFQQNSFEAQEGHLVERQPQHGYAATNRQSNPFPPFPSSASVQNTTKEESPSFQNWLKERQVAPEDRTQRERLVEGLIKGTYECMVCCERVQVAHSIWSCTNCYHIFHLGCIRKWARSPAAVVQDGGWRCPGCQDVNESVPNQYRCFCGKISEPEFNRYDTPHTCGDHCGKQRKVEGCVHRCTILCHPGPCPPCAAQISRYCCCEQTSQVVRCGQSGPVLCDKNCTKLLGCGVHICNQPCHSGNCRECEEKYVKTCYCGKTTKEFGCSTEVQKEKKFTCDQTCDRMLACGNHYCRDSCHAGGCAPCSLLPEYVTHCPCGKTLLGDLLTAKDEPRKSCTDTIATCKKTCNKILQCGPVGSKHKCQVLCHSSECPPCRLTTSLKCRCGLEDRQLACTELGTDASVHCNRRCNKKRLCGRHKCQQVCCNEEEHPCSLTCGRKLNCRLHTCDEPCHRGNCPPCWNASFEELTCHCGGTILYPPVACGTRPPECHMPCSRIHQCGHPVTHNCHSETACPPCTFLTEKPCYGGHEIRKHIPCYLNEISCGMPCGKPLPCTQHKCLVICHAGSCTKDGVKCSQPCPKPRPLCRHPCGLPCHVGPCSPTPCKSAVTVKCRCGHRSEKLPCKETITAFSRMTTALLANKMHDIQSGQTVDVSDVCSNATANPYRLECNAECAVLERNRRVAMALQLRNPDLSTNAGPPNYSDFLKDKAKAFPEFVTSVYDKLTELVQMAKNSKQRNRSHSFPSMNRDHRRVIHELAEFFGCETVSYDEEPNKNVVATAFRDRSWLPTVSLMTVVGKELGQRKSLKGPALLPTQFAVRQSSAKVHSEELKPAVKTESSAPPVRPPIDYFDYEE